MRADAPPDIRKELGAVLEKLEMLDLPNPSAKDEQARDQLTKTLTNLERAAQRFALRRDARRAGS